MPSILTGWTIQPLGQALQLQRGFDLPHHARRPGPVPVVSSAGICGTHDQALVPGPGIVTGRYGTLGQVFYIPQAFWPLNTTLFVSDFKGNHPLFLSYLLRTVDVHAHCGKSSVPGVNRNDLHALPICMPLDLGEQAALANVLADMDALLDALKRTIHKKTAIQKAAAHRLLTGKQRLPGFFMDTWTLKRLGDIARFFSGGTPKTSVDAHYRGDIPWITSGDLNQRVITSVEGRISELGLKNSAAKMIGENTLLIALYGATAGVTAISKIKAAINQAVLAVLPISADPLFLFHWLTHFRERRLNAHTQGGQPNLSARIIQSIEISLPSLPEQRAVAQVLADMDADIAAENARLLKYQSLQRALMHRLLSGKARLPARAMSPPHTSKSPAQASKPR